jgi:hypothetical protein
VGNAEHCGGIAGGKWVHLHDDVHVVGLYIDRDYCVEPNDTA